MRNKKVAVFVCHDLVGLLMLNGVVPAMTSMGLTPVIFNTTSKRNRKFKVPTPSMVSAFNVGLLEDVILPFAEKRHSIILNCMTYRQLADRYNAEYYEIDDVNAREVMKKISDDADIIGAFSMRFLQVFDAPMISKIREKGFFWNLHSGLLGMYKGLLIPYRAIKNGEKEYGVTLHEMAAGIDEGGILDKGVLPLDKSKPVMELYMDTVDASVRIISEALEKICRSEGLKAEKQEAGGACYSNPTEQEFISYMQEGIFYADPQTTVKKIADAFTTPQSDQNKILFTMIRSFIYGVEEEKNTLQKGIAG